MDFEGAIPPIVTPMDDSGDIDISCLHEYVQFLEDGGVHGLFPCGSTGELASLTARERKRVVEAVVETASVPVLAGCGDTSSRTVIDQIDAAADCGADAAVVTSPYYMPTTDASHRAFFEHVADNSSLPVFLYNIPALTGRNIKVDSVVAIADHDRIVGIKDTTGDLLRSRRLVTRTPEDFYVFHGVGTQFFSALDVGVDGLIGGTINVLPDVLSTFYESHQSGDRDRARRITGEVVLPLIDAFSDGRELSNIKFLVGEAGPDVGDPRLPLPEIDADRKRELRSAYRDVRERYEAFPKTDPSSIGHD